ncbi:hypothetical protein GCM10023172_23720 [Hymenobacter ginsengisoli]|uniref:SGNH hydrolase-type esterase domain-containing protein n=1 Tax=Hymenobacter ginsengisoli TaxID=1051626 RepID=A0ABP8QDF4_9BACT|nr:MULTISPECIES: hypothetical protein [unclassified Hymenobacter]MBO2033234.1 hypothetical protein [Hymenobacter sp. BT559]
MKPVELVVVGGCHVAGFPIGPEQAFPTQLSALLGGRLVGEVSYLKFTSLPEHLRLIDQLRPSHVVLQLGNHEFANSFRPLLRQLSAALLPQRPGRPLASPPRKSAKPEAGPAGTQLPWLGARLRHWVRVGGLSLLTALLWLVSPAHRRSFWALNACIRRHPGTEFVFLSPFPSLNPTQHAVRHFGGWLLRRHLVARANCHWLDSHRLLRADRQLFVDATHLNQRAHRVLAYGLATAMLANLDVLL